MLCFNVLLLFSDASGAGRIIHLDCETRFLETCNLAVHCSAGDAISESNYPILLGRAWLPNHSSQ
jgi:hypothetical protein